MQRLYAASQMQASANPSSGDLLGSSTVDLTTTGSSAVATAPFDAIIAIGVLIKGDTVHFEHIAESVSRGLMRVQLDFGVPVIFGLLTVLNEDQAKKRAGLTPDGHNHGEDWGDAGEWSGVLSTYEVSMDLLTVWFSCRDGLQQEDVGGWYYSVKRTQSYWLMGVRRTDDTRYAYEKWGHIIGRNQISPSTNKPTK